MLELAAFWRSDDGGKTYVAKPHSTDSSFGNNDFDNTASGANIP